MGIKEADAQKNEEGTPSNLDAHKRVALDELAPKFG